MAYKELFLYFCKKSDFTVALSRGEVLPTQIAFIEDTKEIWTHNQYFPNEGSSSGWDFVIPEGQSVVGDFNNSLLGWGGDDMSIGNVSLATKIHSSEPLMRITSYTSPPSSATESFVIYDSENLTSQKIQQILTVGSDIVFNKHVVCSAGAGVSSVSDMRFKEVISPLNNVLEKVLDLGTFKFKLKGQNIDKEYMGMSAQQLQDYFPEVVYEMKNEEKTLTVDYTQLVPVLVKAIQDQQEIINNLKSEVEGLKNKIG